MRADAAAKISHRQQLKLAKQAAKASELIVWLLLIICLYCLLSLL